MLEFELCELCVKGHHAIKCLYDQDRQVPETVQTFMKEHNLHRYDLRDDGYGDNLTIEKEKVFVNWAGAIITNCDLSSLFEDSDYVAIDNDRLEFDFVDRFVTLNEFVNL